MRNVNYPNQGHQIVAGWDNESLLKDWTAYFGTDGERFAPPYDRNGYSDGVKRRLNNGRIKMVGRIVIALTHPAITDGQIAALQNTFTVDGVSGPVTIAMHYPGAVGRLTVARYNAYINIDTDQLKTLQRENNAYVGFVTEYVVEEVL